VQPNGVIESEDESELEAQSRVYDMSIGVTGKRMIAEDPAADDCLTQQAQITFGIDYEVGVEVVDTSQMKNEDYNEQDIEGNLIQKGNRLLNQLPVKKDPFQFDKITHGKKSKNKEHNPFEQPDLDNLDISKFSPKNLNSGYELAHERAKPRYVVKIKGKAKNRRDRNNNNEDLPELTVQPSAVTFTNVDETQATSSIADHHVGES